MPDKQKDMSDKKGQRAMFKVYDENGKCIFESESSEACEVVCDALADLYESRDYTEWVLKCVDNSNNVWYAREW